MAKASATVNVQGADELERSLRRLAKDIKSMDQEARAGAELVQASAQSFARVLTGRMQGSIRISSTSNGAQVSAGEGLGIYPAVQEYGSRRRNISANRYMARAYEASEPRVAQLFETAVNRAADKVKGA